MATKRMTLLKKKVKKARGSIGGIVSRASLKHKIDRMADRVGNKLDEAFARGDEDATVNLGVKFITLLNLGHQLTKASSKSKKGRVR